MARFRYRMQNILNIKEKLEEQAKITYGLAEQKYRTEQAALAKLMARKTSYERELTQAMTGNIDLNNVKNLREAVDSMKFLIRRQMLEVHKAEMELDAARAALMNVRQERMMHEKLREKALEEYRREELAEEGKEIDQLVSYTYNGGNK